MMRLIAVCLCAAAQTHAYRIQGSLDENKPFAPYERGFVENVQDPITAQRTRVNQGYGASVVLGDSVGKNRLFSCPRMVGPIDEKYYCGGKEYGYCDRRSGICFCNDGYSGDSCQQCNPSHFDLGGLCYPKRPCPNDCSNAGECDYLTGYCKCKAHREGDDCSMSKCSSFHEFCTQCNDNGCIECEEGFSVMAAADVGFQCEPCYRFDPRCRNCNATACTSCVDLLLLSIHRSGRRPQDPPLPMDELTRELSVTVPFGSTQEDSFYDAEHYFLVDPALVPLNKSAVQCHQGLNFDDSMTCSPYNMTSHIMCGNHGTITFDSPEYAVREDAKHIRLTLQRSGGGVGEVSVAYSIYPITAGYEDVTSTAHYTANQTVVFRHGQIRASFLVTINDDRIMEQNETFSVHLSNPNPLGKVRLGTQQRTIVTIIDDDVHQTCSSTTALGRNESDLGQVEAGVPLLFNIFASSCSGETQKSGGDIFKAIASRRSSAGNGLGPLFVGTFHDMEDGTYDGLLNVTTTGNYDLDVYLLIPGGLRGTYFTDSFLTNSRLDLIRIDAMVNFTFGLGPITTFGRDFVSIRWEGYVLPLITETYTFWLDIDEQARLWIDGVLLIDSWSFSPTSNLLNAQHDLVAFNTHEIVLEFRDIIGNATARLLWSSASTPLSAIPSSSLLYRESIGRYNFTVHPTTVSAPKSVAVGEGLYTGVAGNELSFVIQPNDAFGNFRGWPMQAQLGDSRHLDHFHANAELLNDVDVHVPVTLMYDDTTRKYQASYTPATSGLYQLNVTILDEGSENAMHIFGSPFIVDVQPAVTFAQHSTVRGSGIYSGTAGENSIFTIESYDKHRNKKSLGGDKWDVKVSGNRDDYHYGLVADHLNGTYAVSVIPVKSGQNEVHINLDGSPIRGSPFVMNVVPNKAVATSSFVITNEDSMVMTAMTENILIVQAMDEWGNEAIAGDLEALAAQFEVISHAIDPAKTVVTHIGGGKYEVEVTPTQTGSNYLTIKLDALDIAGSPFNVTVLPGVFSSQFTTAERAAIRKSTAGMVSSFVIQSRDGAGNDKMLNDVTFDVRMSLIERQPTPDGLVLKEINEEVTVFGNVTFVGDGQYEVQYQCNISGVYLLSVIEEGRGHIQGSPVSVNIAPSTMSPSHSIVTGTGAVSGEAGSLTPLRVYARDRFGNFVDSAVEIIETTLTLLSSSNRNEISDMEPSLSARSQMAGDIGNGMFVLDYTPTLAGNYELTMTTYSPGGIIGSLFSSPDLSPDNLITTGTPDDIDLYFGVCDNNTNCELTEPTIAGAIWSGRISADYDEEYTVGVECNHGGLASMSIDGKYTGWQKCSPIMTTTLLMKANKAVDFSLRFSHQDGVALFITLKWKSPSTGEFVKVPSRNLFHTLAIVDTPMYPVISPGTMYPPMSVATGESLVTSVSGEEHKFLIESRDKWGNYIHNGGAQALAYAYHGPERLKASVVDNLDGTYTAKFVPGTSGYYWLRVTLNGSDIQASPFIMTVLPGKSDPQTSRLLVDGPINSMIGQNLNLDMQAADSFGNNARGGEDIVHAILISTAYNDVSKNEYSCITKHKAKGVYSIDCPALRQAGDYFLSVQLGDDLDTLMHISGSPFDVTLRESVAVPETTEVNSNDTPVAVTSVAGFFSSFIVTAKDRFGNRLQRGGESFVARLRGDINAAAADNLIMVADQDNGDYLFVYKVSYPSTYQIDVRMATRRGLIGEYYMSSDGFEDGNPDTKVDDEINFSLANLQPSAFFTKIRWTGYISFPHNGSFQIQISGVEGRCRVWIGNDVMLDTAEYRPNPASFDAVEGHLYDFEIEYSLDSARLFLTLEWSSRQLSLQTVPKLHLFNTAEPIRGSPFDLTVT